MMYIYISNDFGGY